MLWFPGCGQELVGPALCQLVPSSDLCVLHDDLDNGLCHRRWEHDRLLYTCCGQCATAHRPGYRHSAASATAVGRRGLAARATCAVPGPETGRGALAAQTNGVAAEAKRQRR